MAVYTTTRTLLVNTLLPSLSITHTHTHTHILSLCLFFFFHLPFVKATGQNKLLHLPFVKATGQNKLLHLPFTKATGQNKLLHLVSLPPSVSSAIQLQVDPDTVWGLHSTCAVFVCCAVCMFVCVTLVLCCMSVPHCSTVLHVCLSHCSTVLHVCLCHTAILLHVCVPLQYCVACLSVSHCSTVLHVCLCHTAVLCCMSHCSSVACRVTQQYRVACLSVSHCSTVLHICVTQQYCSGLPQQLPSLTWPVSSFSSLWFSSAGASLKGGENQEYTVAVNRDPQPLRCGQKRQGRQHVSRTRPLAQWRKQ